MHMSRNFDLKYHPCLFGVWLEKKRVEGTDLWTDQATGRTSSQKTATPTTAAKTAACSDQYLSVTLWKNQPKIIASNRQTWQPQWLKIMYVHQGQKCCPLHMFEWHKLKLSQ